MNLSYIYLAQFYTHLVSPISHDAPRTGIKAQCAVTQGSYEDSTRWRPAEVSECCLETAPRFMCYKDGQM